MMDTPIPVEPGKPAEQKRRAVTVFYSGSSRHTRTIAERVGHGVRACGFPLKMHSVWGLEPFELGRSSTVMLVAPVHAGKHEGAMVNFVKTHRAELEDLPVAFISAAVHAGDGQPRGEASQGRAQFDGDVQMDGNPFFAETGWHPMRVSSFAGVISYTRYNFFVRWILRLLGPKGGPGSGEGGGPTGERGEAGWDALDVFVEEFVRENCAAAIPGLGLSAASAA